jgi:ADP-ribose pyrophosphatase YjhB (NUDIX family)
VLEQAAVRELREEIGMLSCRAVEPSSVAGVVIVRDVRYRPRRWSWEVEAVCEADPSALPSRRLAARTRLAARHRCPDMTMPRRFRRGTVCSAIKPSA